MKIDCVIGIDPGVSGGIAIYRIKRAIEVKKMPKDLKEVGEYLKYLKTICVPLVFIEKVQMRPNDLTDNPGKVYRVETMLANFERLKTIIELAGVPFVLVHPQKWQNTLRLRVKGESKEDRKNRYKQAAGNMYPEINPTLWNADAIMLMHFGRYILQNDISWVVQNLPSNLKNSIF